MTEIDDSAAGFYVKVGPFEDRARAEKVRKFLDAMEAEARVNADGELPPANVINAIMDGHDWLQKGPGHYELRVDGAPKAPAAVDFSAGRKYSKAG